jgi:GalNAc-alpha-(1->4)-GalNAc-alpha-(1->3)-diNAcBac-PP-undecaprenol alpha-1,4-N-acetyl-D-galactosaminyltransferase
MQTQSDLPRISIVISSLGGGGAQRTAVTVANHWAASGRAVTMATLYHGDAPSAFPLDARVTRTDAGLRSRENRGEAALLADIRQFVISTRPDVVLSLIDQTNIRVANALRGSGIALFVWEQIDARPIPSGEWEEARREAYATAVAGVIALTEEDARYFGAGTHVVFNPVARSRDSARPRLPLIAGAGRLEEQKGFDILLAAFARVATAHAGWNVVILGEGREREALTKRARDLVIGDRVSMPGFLPDPVDVYASAAIFAMPSRREGFPNALLEGMAHGAAPVVSDCAPGMYEIVRDGIDGLVVPSRVVTPFADALDRLMTNDEERRRFGERAADVVTRFSVEEAVARLDRIFEGGKAG